MSNAGRSSHIKHAGVIMPMPIALPPNVIRDGAAARPCIAGQQWSVVVWAEGEDRGAVIVIIQWPLERPFKAKFSEYITKAGKCLNSHKNFRVGLAASNESYWSTGLIVADFPINLVIARQLAQNVQSILHGAIRQAF